MTRRKFEYQDNDPSVGEKHATSKGDYDNPIRDDIKMFTPKEGKNRVRILPRTWVDSEGPEHWAFPIHLHFGIGPDNSSYLCPTKMGKGTCPICEERGRLDATGDKEAARELRVALYQLVWIIDRNDEDVGPKAWRMPASKLEGPICDLSRDEDTGAILKIDHPADGYDVTFTRSGTGRNTDYTAPAVVRKQTYLSENEELEQEWLDYISANPLPTILNHYDTQYITNVFGGATTARDSALDEDEDDSPPPRSRRSRERTEASDTSDDDLDAPSADEDDSPPRKRDLRGEVKDGLRKRKRTRSSD